MQVVEVDYRYIDSLTSKVMAMLGNSGVTTHDGMGIGGLMLARLSAEKELKVAEELKFVEDLMSWISAYWPEGEA